MKKTRIVLTTGGSGGHIFPAQATAEALLAKDMEVVFITDKRGKAFQGLDKVKTYRLCAESVTGRTFLGKIRAAFLLLYGGIQALLLLKKLKPDMVIGFGSYASVPVGIAAQMLKIPVVLHEQNAVLGRANRTLAKGASLILTSFKKTYLIPQSIPTFWTGLPVRPAILKVANTPYPPEKGYHLLIFGGSQGAAFFAKGVAQAILALPKEIQKKLHLVQQVRPENLEQLKSLYNKAPFASVTLKSFFDDMPQQLVNTHLVIGRAGASTISETLAVGRPVILIPLPTAADNHQKMNALQMEDTHGWLVEEPSFSIPKFSKFLAEVLLDTKVRREKVKRTLKEQTLTANQTIAKVITDMLDGLKKKKH